MIYENAIHEAIYIISPDYVASLHVINARSDLRAPEDRRIASQILLWCLLKSIRTRLFCSIAHR